MTIITIVTIGTNYPDNILIEGGFDKQEEKWKGFIYLLNDDKTIHRLLIDTTSIFDTNELAKERMVELCDWCVKYIKENEVFDA